MLFEIYVYFFQAETDAKYEYILTIQVHVLKLLYSKGRQMNNMYTLTVYTR